MNRDHSIPSHVAVIMDGNGRWAQKRGLPRFKGHEEGANRIEEIARAANNCGVKFLTLYAFSKENWKRPKDEVNFLMTLFDHLIDVKLKPLLEENIALRVIGDIQDLPSVLQKKLANAIQQASKNTGLVLTLALSYSSRFEILRACRNLAEKAAAGKIKPNEITEETFAGELYTAELPDPDLLVRTSGEMRISNFLLWQLSYSELYITETLWPDFHEEDFKQALAAFAKRERRFGLVENRPGANS